MSLSSEGINNAAHFLIDTAYKGIALAGEGLSKGASLAADGASWIGREVVALGPVLKQAASTVADQTVKVATVVASIALKLFSAAITIAQTALSSMATIAQKGYQVGSQFVKNHPGDIAISLCSAAVAVAIVLIAQKAFGDSKEKAAV